MISRKPCDFTNFNQVPVNTYSFTLNVRIVVRTRLDVSGWPLIFKRLFEVTDLVSQLGGYVA